MTSRTPHGCLCRNQTGKALFVVCLNDLTVATIQKYVTGKGNKASTVAREINSIKAMLAHAKAMGCQLQTLNLVRPSVDDSRLRWLTEEERDHLIASCSEGYQEHCDPVVLLDAG